jgi:hypothetical protein
MHIALDRLNAQRLQSYRADPGLVMEHYGIEQTVLAGGYGYRPTCSPSLVHSL